MPEPAGPAAVLPGKPDDLGMPPDGADPDEEEAGRKRQWWRPGRNRASGDDGDGWDCDDWSCDGCDGWDCDGCDCGGCDLMRLSTVLVVVAALHPPGAPGRIAALGALRLYRRLLSRFTPRCPNEPSCSAYAETAVRRHGARRGLAAAARRARACSSGHP